MWPIGKVLTMEKGEMARWQLHGQVIAIAGTIEGLEGRKISIPAGLISKISLTFGQLKCRIFGWFFGQDTIYRDDIQMIYM